MKKTQTPHNLQIEIRQEEIVEAYCTCKAGICGHCSHIVDMIKSLQGLKLHNFTHKPKQQSCTSIPQQWHVPRGTKIQPVAINHVVVAKPSEKRKRKPVVCHADTSYSLPTLTPKDISHLQSLTSTPLATNLSTVVPKVATPLGEVQIGSVLSYQTRDLRRTEPVPHQSCGNVSVHLPSPVKLPDRFTHLNTADENTNMIALEQSTRGQATSNAWFIQRRSRLTASNFAKILGRKSPPTTKFLQSIFPERSISAPALEYGKRNEERAKAKYLEVHPDRHFHECGLVINREFDFLGASPDGKLCDNGKSGIVEVKCPYKARNSLISEACEEWKDFCLKKDDEGNISLKNTHDYFVQVQGQLMVAGCEFCEFIVYTQKDIFVQRIYPDVEFMKTILLKLAVFFQDHASPFLKNLHSPSV